MSGHTPGPWIVAGRTVYAFNEKGFDRFYVQLKDAHTGVEELEANARLIAAAPDMYLALVMLTDTIAFQFAGQVEKELILAAISKATGEAT